MACKGELCHMKASTAGKQEKALSLNPREHANEKKYMTYFQVISTQNSNTTILNNLFHKFKLQLRVAGSRQETHPSRLVLRKVS